MQPATRDVQLGRSYTADAMPRTHAEAPARSAANGKSGQSGISGKRISGQ